MNKTVIQIFDHCVLKRKEKKRPREVTQASKLHGCRCPTIHVVVKIKISTSKTLPLWAPAGVVK